MTMNFIIGDIFTVRDTVRNRNNGLIPGKECRIAHVSGAHVSVIVIQNADYKKLLVPVSEFWNNFDTCQTGMINKGYRSDMPFKDLYK
ncbi:MAG TPA: hypothetical protein PKD99_12625 [Sphingopyxis sp.]|nr:hypothetical protein [Sphingopyxis sp.]HMP45943.1 hypothetical protein [Sphingopyxis sp.]HMQ18311.1 hypothetical protein [Sphingopyxis sp.]